MKTIIVSIFLTLVLALVSLQAFKGYPEQPSPSLTLLEKRIGAEVLEVLQHPSTVVVYSVKPNKPPQYYIAISSEMGLAIDLKIEFQQLLLDDKHFVFGMNKRSPFLPSIAFKFNKENEESIILLVSPSSKQIRILDGQMNYLLDYDPSEVRVNAFIKKIKNLHRQ